MSAIECDAEAFEFDAFDFEDYLIGQYGIKMGIIDGNITDGYEIVDEKKYLIFLLNHQKIFLHKI